MPKKTAYERLDDLIRAAVDLFIQKGYRRTQMADVTRAMGVSPGAIYRYVESKEALFDLVVHASVATDIGLADLQLPIPTPPPGRTLTFLQEAFQRHGRMAALETALACPIVNDARVELEGIIRELYAALARYRQGIKVIERSALDWPELADLWFKGARHGLIDRLQRYLILRSDQGALRAAPDALAAARLIIETCAFFALHRHYDPSPTRLDDDVAEAVVVDALIHAYANR